MIDIHCHLLYGVDDGAKDYEESVAMLEFAKTQGVDEIILTPHYRNGMFSYDKSKIERHYIKLKEYAQESRIKLHIGCEYHVDSDMMDNILNGEVHTLADTDYVLAEYSHMSDYKMMRDTLQELIMSGYTPIVAHAERYDCIQRLPDLAWNLRELGAKIQINADSLLGIDGHQLKKVCKKLLKQRQVDYVASDSHHMKERINHMRDAYIYIGKKYSKELAQQLVEDNPRQIVASK